RAARGEPFRAASGSIAGWPRPGARISRATIEVPAGLLVVLDRRLLAELRGRERGLVSCIADRPIPPQPLLEHARKQRDPTIDVVVDAHLALSRAQPVEAPRVLDERALPRHGHGQEERVQPRVVEPLANVATRRENEALLTVRDGRQLRRRLSSRLGGHATLEYHQVAGEGSQPGPEVLEMVPPLGEEDRSPPFLQGADHIVQDE